VIFLGTQSSRLGGRENVVRTAAIVKRLGLNNIGRKLSVSTGGPEDF